VDTIAIPTTVGLVTEPGEWIRKEGALVAASNVDLSAPGVIAKRRGFVNDTLNSYSGCVYSIHSSPGLEEGVGPSSALIAVGDPTAGGSTGLAFGQLGGTYTAISGAANNLISRRAKLTTGMDGRDVITIFGDTNQGPEVLDYATPAKRKLGVPRGMGLDRQNTTFPAGTMLPNLYSVRYAVVFVFGDPTTNGAQFGAPGMTSVVRNTSGATADVATRVLLPRVYGTTNTALPADVYWVQVYRSAQQLTTAGEPPSELALVFQKVISAADIAAGYVGFTDVVPDVARGANLYTNLATGEDGIAGRGFINSNEPPPAGSDVATWADCLWLSELLDFPTQEAQLISVGGTGLIAADTVTVAGTVYTAVAAAPAANQFIVTAAGTPSENQRETALNIVDAINRSGSNTAVWAYYVAGQVGQPGRIILRGRTTESSIGFATSRAAAFRIGTETSTATLSGVAFSKALQPHAWPVVNRFELGRGSAQVMRILPYRDSLFVFKADGLWRITGGDFRSFSAQEFDLTFRLLGRELVVAMDDALYAWGEQGIARITDGGVEYIDLPIRSVVVDTQDAIASRSRFADYSFAAGRTWDGVVAFWYPNTNGDGNTNLACGQALVFHTKTRLWSTWAITNESDDTIGYACGMTNVADQKMSLGVWVTDPAPGGYVHTERRALDSSDFSDPDMSDSAAPTMAAAAISFNSRWSPIGSTLQGGTQWVRMRASCANYLSGGGRAAPATLTGSALGLGVGGTPAAGGSATVSMTVPQSLPGTYVWPVAQDFARSPILSPVLEHSTINEGVWIVGLGVDYRPLGRRGVGR
jgi:hypothetical protein